MKKITLLLFCAILASVQAMAQTSEDTRKLQGFNSVKISNAIEAELEKGDRNEIHILASGVDLDKVETNVSDRTLEVKLGRGNFRSTSVKVKITYTDLDQVEASSSSRVFVKDPMDAKNIRITAATSSYVEARVNAQYLKLDAASNAKIYVRGTAENLDLRSVTSGDINAKDLEVQHAEVFANTAGKAEFVVKESLKGSAATGAKIIYHGDPRQLEVKENTAGSFSQKK
ncbi:DUF2807 domain-containing protein [Litoribacter ruber]|uniref:head GIN domain-containing protein n=1 Tax=Litoribacter ruber TaxID=702568 RepID=UPI001BD96D11|nr:head GIN domain-containing protein [Litoribacter ruber]MBT0811090.1 DUF2807 domain-containing protein [Litoribacter ruber]